jgi:hypothetical protein
MIRFRFTSRPGSSGPLNSPAPSVHVLQRRGAFASSPVNGPQSSPEIRQLVPYLVCGRLSGLRSNTCVEMFASLARRCSACGRIHQFSGRLSLPRDSVAAICPPTVVGGEEPGGTRYAHSWLVRRSLAAGAAAVVGRSSVDGGGQRARGGAYRCTGTERWWA